MPQTQTPTITNILQIPKTLKNYLLLHLSLSLSSDTPVNEEVKLFCNVLAENWQDLTN